MNQLENETRFKGVDALLNFETVSNKVDWQNIVESFTSHFVVGKILQRRRL